MPRIHRSGQAAEAGAGVARLAGVAGIRSTLVGALIAAATLTSASSALAASGTPVNIGTPFSNEPPSVAVDSAGEAVVAWANTRDLPPTTVDFVQYCVLPVAATACSHAGTLSPADGAEYIDNVQVLVDGSTIVVLADVFGAKGPGGEEYEPEQEWQSTDAGATFVQIDGGKSVADGIIDADTEPLGAVILPGTGVLGYGWDTQGSTPTFNAFPLSSPPGCFRFKCPTGFASLEPNTNPDQITNVPGQFASQTTANPSVMGIFNTDFTNGPLGCPSAQTVPFGTAYAYASGDQSATNNYNISPGNPNSAWKVAVAQADCNVEYAALGAGPSGFGVVEDNDLAGSIVYHRFDSATEEFDTPEATIAGSAFEEDAAVSQNADGGIYATFLNGGVGGPIALAYSSDGGATWTGPAPLNSNADGGAGYLTSSVDATGQGWAAWVDNGSVYAQPFVASDAIPPVVTPPLTSTATTLATSQASGTARGASITVSAGTIGETDRATLAGANAATASGTVTYGLYSNPTCVASSKVFDGGTVGVSAGVAGTSAPITAALAEGTYYWVATYSGDAHNLASSSACGSEVLRVVAASSTVEGTGTSTGTTVTLTITCASTPCTVTVTITVPESGDKAAAARKKKSKRPKIVKLASGSFTITTPGPHKLTLHLTKAGKRLFVRDHGHVKANVLVVEETAGGLEKMTRTVSFSLAKTKHNHKK